MGLGNVDKDLGGGMDNVKELHDGGTVVGDGDRAFVVMNQLIHTPRPQRGPDHVCRSSAGVYVAHQLRLSLGRVRSFL